MGGVGEVEPVEVVAGPAAGVGVEEGAGPGLLPVLGQHAVDVGGDRLPPGDVGVAVVGAGLEGVGEQVEALRLQLGPVGGHEAPHRVFPGGVVGVEGRVGAARPGGDDPEDAVDVDAVVAVFLDRGGDVAEPLGLVGGGADVGQVRVRVGGCGHRLAARVAQDPGVAWVGGVVGECLLVGDAGAAQLPRRRRCRSRPACRSPTCSRAPACPGSCS